MAKQPTDVRTFTYATEQFVVRPYEVGCPRCNAGPWQLCLAMSSPGKTKPIGHPARIAFAQRATKYHVYEMSRGTLLRTFDDVPNAVKFAHEQAQRDDVEDLDAGTLIAFGTGTPLPTVRDHADIPRAGMVLLQTFHRTLVQP